jgi:D-glycero-D-manno-heptose 1,7-bisphosphate phosphatase
VNRVARPALFLDRDGVINIDHGYVYRQEQFEFIDGVFELCVAAKSLGYFIFVVTNQAGIGRGYYSEEDFEALTRWMCDEFSRRGAAIDKVYFCATHPSDGIGKYKTESPFRKPNPGMLLQAAREFNVDLPHSMFIGDKCSDIQAGLASGVGTNLLLVPFDNAIAANDCEARTIQNLKDAIRILKKI